MTADALIIREAHPEDAQTIARIGRETYVEHFSTIWTPEGMARFLDQQFSLPALSSSLYARDAQQWCLVFEPGGEVIGYSKVNWSRPDPIGGAVGAELQKIYFRSSAVGKGYGSRLLAHVIEQAARRNETTIWLNVLETNVAGQRFYLRHGFLDAGAMTFRTDKDDIRMRVMKRLLR